MIRVLTILAAVIALAVTAAPASAFVTGNQTHTAPPGRVKSSAPKGTGPARAKRAVLHENVDYVKIKIEDVLVTSSESGRSPRQRRMRLTPRAAGRTQPARAR